MNIILDLNSYDNKEGPYCRKYFQLEPNTEYFVSSKRIAGTKLPNTTCFIGDIETYDSVNANGIFTLFNRDIEMKFLTGESGKMVLKRLDYSGNDKNILEEFKNNEVIISKGTTAIPYEPYTGGIPSPNPDYPQEIVNAGKLNEETGKYEVKITLVNVQESPTETQEVTLTSDRPITKWDRLEKRDGVWGWVYNTLEMMIPKNAKVTTYTPWNLFVIDSVLPFKTSVNPGYCNYFRIGNVQKDKNSIQIGNSDRNINVRCDFYNNDLPDKGLQNFKDFLQQKEVIVWTKNNVSEFVPLQQSEQDLLNSLHTYYPVTIVTNDQDCQMQMRYIADTKTYIDNKFLQLATTLVERGI